MAREMEAGSPEVVVYTSLKRAVRFFYECGPRLILLSVLWFVASLPLITLGPATVGAFAAIVSLREDGRFDRERVQRTVVRRAVPALLACALPAVFAGIALLYFRRYLATASTLAFASSVVATWACIYAVLVLVPTFVAFAGDASVEAAFRAGFRFTRRNGLASVFMGAITLVLFAVLAALTVAFVLAFAGVAFSFQIEVVERLREPAAVEA